MKFLSKVISFFTHTKRTIYDGKEKFAFPDKYLVQINPNNYN